MNHLVNPQPLLATQILLWVRTRIHNAISPVDGVHYEASLYGPFNNLFNLVFPVQQNFMIQPQAVLRKEWDGDFSSDVGSIGSGPRDLGDFEEGGLHNGLDIPANETHELEEYGGAGDFSVDSQDARVGEYHAFTNEYC